jgi:hypothetical protein
MEEFQFSGARRGSLAASIGDPIYQPKGFIHDLFKSDEGDGALACIWSVFDGRSGSNLGGGDDRERHVFIRSHFLPPDCIEVTRDGVPQKHPSQIKALKDEIRRWLVAPCTPELPTRHEKQKQKDEAIVPGMEESPPVIPATKPSGSFEEEAVPPNQESAQDSTTLQMFSVADIRDLNSFVIRLFANADAVAGFLNDQIKKSALKSAFDAQMGRRLGGYSNEENLKTVLVEILNEIIKGLSIYKEALFKGIVLRDETKRLRDQKNLKADDVIRLNRLLLEDVLDQELSGKPRGIWPVFPKFVHPSTARPPSPIEMRRASSERKILEWTDEEVGEGVPLFNEIAQQKEKIRKERLENPNDPDSHIGASGICEAEAVEGFILSLPLNEIKPFLFKWCCDPGMEIHCDASFYDALTSRLAQESTYVLINLFRGGPHALSESVKSKVADGICQAEKGCDLFAYRLAVFDPERDLFLEWLGKCARFFPRGFHERVFGHWTIINSRGLGSDIWARRSLLGSLISTLKRLPENQCRDAVRVVAGYYLQDKARRLRWLYDNGEDDGVGLVAELMDKAGVSSDAWPLWLKDILKSLTPEARSRATIMTTQL